MASIEQTLPPPIVHTKRANIIESSPGSISNEHRTSKFVEHPNGSDGWLPTEDHHETARDTSPDRRVEPPPISSTAGAAESSDVDETRRVSRVGSIMSRKTGSVKRSGSAFAKGAGTTGPGATAEVDEELESRKAEAHKNLTPKQRSKIYQEEAKHSKRLSRIIKEEAKTEKKSLALAISELENLQRHQKAAVKSEARVHASQQALLTKFKKQEAAYLNAKMAYETSLSQLRAEEDTLETLRQNSREATERVQEKAAEVDNLRATLAVDERERQIKLDELKGRSPRGNRSSSFWKGE